MASKQLLVDEIGLVDFQKRRNARSIRIRINGPKVQVSMPLWVPYRAAVEFVRSKQRWITDNQSKSPVFADGMRIGHKHRLRFMPGEDVARSRVTNNEIQVYMASQDTQAQEVIEKACKRALRSEAEEYLPGRVQYLAREAGYEHTSVICRYMRGRWGSCDSHGNIVLNIYLMQLPWHLIDYVILHELAHTTHHNHSPEFWAELAASTPEYKKLRAELKHYHPHILPYREV